MEENQLTPLQAFELLDKATQPGVKLGRLDYVAIQEALQTIYPFLKEEDSKD